MHGTLRFQLYLSHLFVRNMCENLHYESVYFKELHNEQEYYRQTIYRAGAGVMSTITTQCSYNVIMIASQKREIFYTILYTEDKGTYEPKSTLE